MKVTKLTFPTEDRFYENGSWPAHVTKCQFSKLLIDLKFKSIRLFKIPHGFFINKDLDIKINQLILTIGNGSGPGVVQRKS